MFKEPEITVTRFEVEDVMAISGDDQFGGGEEE